MAISSVKIANFALSKVGTDSTIETLTENSAEAKACNLWFETARKQALSAYDWSFARKRLALAVHGDDPPDEWAYRYQYPADCVKARFVENPVGKTADPVPFSVEMSADGTKSVLTDEVDAILIYTKEETSPDYYTPYFIELFATVLASRIAFSITHKAKLTEYLDAIVRFLLIYAPAMDAVEQQEAAPRGADWIRGRT